MIDLLRLCRLYYSVPMSLILTLTLWYALGEAAETQRRSTLLATGALFLVIAGGYVLNDACDWRIDQVNCPARPVAAGRVRPSRAIAWALVLIAAGLLCGAFCRPAFLIALSVVAVILVVYDLSSKWLGIGKPLLVALLMISFYPLAFAQAGSPAGPRSATLYLFPIWLFCTSFGYEILKDLRDVPGDETAGKRQVWVRRSPRRALLLSRVAILVGAGVLIGPYHAGCGSIYLWIALPAIGVAIASCFVHSRRAQALIYAECVIVGIAAAADMIALT